MSAPEITTTGVYTRALELLEAAGVDRLTASQDLIVFAVMHGIGTMGRNEVDLALRHIRRGIDRGEYDPPPSASAPKH